MSGGWVRWASDAVVVAMQGGSRAGECGERWTTSERVYQTWIGLSQPEVTWHRFACPVTITSTSTPPLTSACSRCFSLRMDATSSSTLLYFLKKLLR